MATAIAKFCKICGNDVSNSKRTKNTAGEYFCEPCVGRLKASAGIPAIPQPSAPAAAASVHPTDDTKTAQVQPVASPSRAKKHSRMLLIGGSVAVVFAGGIWYVSSFNASINQTFDKDIAAQMKYSAAAMQKDKQTIEKAQRQIDRGNAEIQALNDGRSSETASESRTKSYAIKHSLFISALVDSYPEMDQLIKDGGRRLDSKLALMVSSGLLSPRHCDMITSFSQSIHDLPD